MLVANGIYLSALSFLHIYTLTDFFSTESCQSTLTVSHSGYDDSKCGFNRHPCRTLSYTLDKRVKADDVIQINGQDGIPYLMKKQRPVLASTTLIGTEGRAKIVGEFSVVGSYLFADAARGLYTSQEQVSIKLVNLKLIRIGIIKLKNTLTTLNVQVFNCTVSKLSKSPIVDSSAAKTTVIFKKSIISQVSKGLQVKSKEVSLSIESSKINNLGRSCPERNCPQFIVTHEFESFVACFRKSFFKCTFLIDLGVSNQKKSNFSILDSVFDDESGNFKHNGCFSGITLRNTSALIVNSSFTNIISRNSLIKAIASFVTFKECIFSNISSRLGMFSLSSSIIGSFNKTNAIHSRLNGFNHGSVYLHSTEGILQTCTFHSNTIDGQYGIGGALYISNSNIIVQQSLFKENTAIYMGGAIYMEKTRASLVNCTFERNSAKSLLFKMVYGGAISSVDRSNITVQQSLFKENTATYNGGAIYMQKTRGSLVNCTFERNSAKSLPHKKTVGGAISSVDRSNITVQKSLFKENTATYMGGAIYLRKTRGSLVNCIFERNSAKSLPQKMVYGGAISSVGGAIHMQKTRGSVVNCTFERNSAKSLPHKKTVDGAISSVDRSNITVQQSLFKENTATYMGCAIYMRKTRGSLVNCTFERNSAKRLPHKMVYGGAISSFDRSNITVQQSLFKENTVTYSGGAIHMEKTRGSFVNCTFERNSAKSLPHKAVYGGAISSADRSNITVQQSLFKENTVTYCGGAIHMERTRGSFVNCTFERNSAKSLPHKPVYGGAISSLGRSNITVQQSLFKENTETYMGGAIYMQKTRGSLVNCTFERNSAKSLPHKMVYGGAISSGDRSNITVQQSLFKENTVTYSGGAIYMQKTRGSLVNCTFERNSAKSLPHKMVYGGAISSLGSSNITVQQSLFKENTVTYSGGAIHMEKTRGSFVNCTFERNSAKSLPHKAVHGGAISSVDRSNITVQQSLFKENTVTNSGGAIHMEKTRGSFVNCTFERNSAKSLPQKAVYGGAISSFDRSNITVQQSLFKENTATYNGSAIYMQKTRGSLVNCTFERNSAKCLPHKMVYGGAISSGDRSNITVQQSLFKENTVTYSGGAIHMEKTRGSFVNCTFERNSAKSLPHKAVYGGAISSADRSNITVQQSLFKENTATYMGGAIYLRKTRGSLVNCIFERNSAKSLPQKMVYGGAISSVGGAIHMQKTRGSVVNCAFERNSAKSLPHKKTVGGAISSVDRSNITVQQSLFKENTVTYCGGAIHMEKTRGSLVNCTFERNSAKRLPHKAVYGGAISSFDRSNITVQQSLFKENTATYCGGAIYVQEARSSFVNCTFERNSAKSLPHKAVYGGAISSGDRSNITVQQCLFKENTVTHSGGAIHMEKTRGSFVNCTFERNSAKSLPQKTVYGGAISSFDRSNITVQQSLFKENTATYCGGAICVQEARSSFVNCTFERNSAKSLPHKEVYGGAISSIYRSNITVQQSLFKENTATYHGGAIYMKKARGSLVNCTFESK